MISEDGGASTLQRPLPDKSMPAAKKPVRIKMHASLNQSYNFERFVVGASNQFAHAAAVFRSGTACKKL